MLDLISVVLMFGSVALAVIYSYGCAALKGVRQ
jgi:hypothetical protein